MIPDKEERAYIRQGYIQTLTKELLQEIESRVMNKETFSPIEYCMREPLLYTYQKYGGKEEI
ncbi:MAG: hypothetical protein LBO09_03920 [Candidatus Peribacteria bacterium]|nr:hypothetical protein [Candidatus Peribacteria bacterium]